MAEGAAAVRIRGEGSISVRGVSHVYKGGVKALDDVSLEIGKGLFGLLGPNGAGKSTLMRVLCTLLVPTSGSASVAGFDVVAQRREIRRRIGYLPQEFGAWRLQRVREVLETLGRMSRLAGKKERRARIDTVLEQVGLSEVADRKVKKLSGGMVRRLGVAQALLHEPEVIVVDEPTVGLDPEERIRFRELMAQLAEERTIVLSTHIVADLGQGCRDLAMLAGGKLIHRGSPEELIARAKGRVFDLVLSAEDASPLPDGIEEVSRSVGGGRQVVRAVSASRSIPEGAVAIEKVSLEEAYLAFMTSQGHAGGDTLEGAR